MTLSDENGRCFACGPNNPCGLHLEFRLEGEEYLTDFVPDERHQGFDGLMHGGIMSTLLDEVMARGLWVRGIPAVTAELQINLHRPAHLGEKLTVRARTTRDRGRLILCEASAARPDGTVVARAEGKFLRVTNVP